MKTADTTVQMFGEFPFKSIARIDRESGTGIIEIEAAGKTPVMLVFSNTNAALALTEALLHLSQEMLKNASTKIIDHQMGEYCVVGDDTAQLVKSALSGHPLDSC